MNIIRQVFLVSSCKKVFFQAVRLAKKRTNLSLSEKDTIKTTLSHFQDLILNSPKSLTKKHLIEFKDFKKNYLDLKGFKKWQHFVITTAFALAAALVIRQMWFELYKVPTGSMRPTIKELDHLTVSKLNFSLNIPFTPKHFYFDPNLVQRSSICVFTSENMDVADSDTKYFYIIPGKKLLVKRLIAKPSDILYFYGGKMYGVNKEGEDISQQLNPENIEHIEHIPFIQWYGEKEISFNGRQGTLYHMNAPFLNFDMSGQWSFSIPESLKSSRAQFPSNPSAPWGLDNYAQARILTNQTKKMLYPQDNHNSSKGLYLELKHHLKITNPSFNPKSNQSMPLGLETSIIPLDEPSAKTLFSLLTTARFEVKNGTLRRYGSSYPFGSKQLPKLAHIPDGTYEFNSGIASKVLFGGILKTLPSDHPIYRFSSTSLEILFNLGIDFSTFFSPGNYEGWAPPRYSYFREGHLYVMGQKFLPKNSSLLQNFLNEELMKSNQDRTYIPFLDQGAPVKSDGTLDTGKILQLGMKVPESMYFVLGDNHAQSADSRVFGFVPQNNLKGCPDIIFWPPGSRWGHLPQAVMETITLPRAMVWSTAWIMTIVWFRQKKKREAFPQDLSFL
jgi:signal peptidase I